MDGKTETTMAIHILMAGEQRGPFSESEVRDYLGQGVVSLKDLATFDGLPGWKSLDLILDDLPSAQPGDETFATNGHSVEPAAPPALVPETPPSDSESSSPEPVLPDVAPDEPPFDPTASQTLVPETSHPEPPGSEETPTRHAASAETASLDASSTETSPPAKSAPEPPLPMHHHANSALESPPPPTRTGILLPLTASQKTKRKLNKIVIQPILPLEATAPEQKKSRTGKTALTLEPLRPTTALPPITRPASLVREKDKKTGKTLIPPVQLALRDFPEKAADPAPLVLPPEPVAPPAAEAELPPPPLPIPVAPPPEVVRKESSARKRWSKIPRELLLAIVLALILYGIISLVRHLIFAHPDSPPAAAAAPEPASAPLLSDQAEIRSPITNPTTAAEFDDRGVSRQSGGDLEGAIQDFEQALNLDPKNVNAFYHRGLARQAKREWDGALSDYTQVVTLDPKQANAYSNRAFVKQSKGDLDGALADYHQALLIDPKIPLAYYNVGLIEVQKGDLDGAIADYNHALDLDPKMAFAYYNRGNAKNTEGNLEGAIADYTQALTLNPKNALAFCNRGFARQSKGDPDGALDDYAQALALNPKMAVAFYNRGLIKVQKGDLDGAIADSSQAIDLDPKNGQAYCNRGLAQLGKGDLEKAGADLKKFCELFPRDSGADSARLYLWLIATEENPRGHADEELSTAVQNDWNSPPEDLTSKIAAFLLGHISEGALIANAASPDPGREPGQYCKAWYFAGMKRLLKGDSTSAATDFQKCVATDQKDFCEYIFAKAKLRELTPDHGASAKAETKL